MCVCVGVCVTQPFLDAMPSMQCNDTAEQPLPKTENVISLR